MIQDSFRIINVYQCLFTLILFDEVGKGLENEKNLLLDTIYMILLKKIMDENKYCTAKDDNV